MRDIWGRANKLVDGAMEYMQGEIGRTAGKVSRRRPLNTKALNAIDFGQQ